MAGSASAGNVPSSRTLDLGNIGAGSWVQHVDGRVLELLEYDPRLGGTMIFVDVAMDVDLPRWVLEDLEDPNGAALDGPAIVRLSSLKAARELAGVVRAAPEPPPVGDR